MAVENRGPYQWRARIRRKGLPSQTKTFETKYEAEAWERMILSEMDRGVFVSRTSAESTTLLECLERYLKEIVPGKKGYKQDESRIRVLKGLPIAHYYMASIRGSDIASVRDEMLRDGKSPSTVVKYLAVISHLFNIARKEWGMESLANPVELIRKPIVKNSRDRRLEESFDGKESEEEKLLRGCRRQGNPWLEPLVTLAIETAMRKGEMLDLTWNNIDLKDRVVFLPDTKNGESREVPLSPRAIKVLKSLPKSISGKVFGTTSYATRKAFIKVCVKAKDAEGEPAPIEGLTFHDLRHEATSRLAEIYPAQDLAKITGHKDLKMILRYYHPRGKDLAKKLK
ncbi:phage integrase family protein [Mariprofundus micogutta]|uniref:Phage integrase family protein n=1 Tax=Mariprofundus micogutta TaxID=1921010 RepID=A0A1L8CN66_9PROT|nr:site-specific integrase [Mariprofundus micogutta]GAV20355.1 phage integrase family protein [Mariprofundus micogutta]